VRLRGDDAAEDHAGSEATDHSTGAAAARADHFDSSRWCRFQLRRTGTAAASETAKAIVIVNLVERGVRMALPSL